MAERRSTTEKAAAAVGGNGAVATYSSYSDEEVVTALEVIFEETLALSRQVRAAGEDVYPKDDLSRGMRSVLRNLDRFGPQTVPQLARRRQCSRQHVQLLVNDLLAGEYVELIDNPAHRRSHLVSLTPRGQSLMKRIRDHEVRLLKGLEIDVPASDLRAAALVLHSVRSAFENDRWHRSLTTE